VNEHSGSPGGTVVALCMRMKHSIKNSTSLDQKAIPSNGFMNPQEQHDIAFDESPFDGKAFKGATNGLIAACNLEETDTAYVVTLDIPGVKKEDVKVELRDHHLLVIKGERKEEHDHQAVSLHATERFYGKFERTIALPNAVKAAQLDVHYHHGALTVIAAKDEPKKSKEIKISRH
jgi:HSP20 family protein